MEVFCIRSVRRVLWLMSSASGGEIVVAVLC